MYMLLVLVFTVAMNGNVAMTQVQTGPYTSSAICEQVSHEVEAEMSKTYTNGSTTWVVDVKATCMPAH